MANFWMRRPLAPKAEEASALRFLARTGLSAAAAKVKGGRNTGSLDNPIHGFEAPRRAASGPVALTVQGNGNPPKGSTQKSLDDWVKRIIPLSSFDIRNFMTANFSYAVPAWEKLTGISGKLVNGWQLNGILSASNGVPLSILDSNSAQTTRIGTNEGLRASLIPGGNDDPVLGGPNKYYNTSQFVPSALGYFGNLGRDTLIGPGLVNFDFSLFKDFPVTEKSRLQFRAEIFNLLNHVNFGTPNTTNFLANGQPNAAAGQITVTGTRTPREIQFAMKFIF